MDCYDKFQTKQLHACKNICTHNSWWLVRGWVTTKAYNPRLCIDYVDFMARYKCNYIYIYVTLLSDVSTRDVTMALRMSR